MKIFTARALDRETARVLEACDAEGAVLIKHRNGRNYLLQAERRKTPSGERPNFRARRTALFRAKVLPPQTVGKLDRLIAGE